MALARVLIFEHSRAMGVIMTKNDILANLALALTAMTIDNLDTWQAHVAFREACQGLTGQGYEEAVKLFNIRTWELAQLSSPLKGEVGYGYNCLSVAAPKGAIGYIGGGHASVIVFIDSTGVVLAEHGVMAKSMNGFESVRTGPKNSKSLKAALEAGSAQVRRLT